LTCAAIAAVVMLPGRLHGNALFLRLHVGVLVAQVS
jgi:hypothetical protein